MSVTRFLMKLFLGKRLPILDGHIDISGLRQTVRIRRDTYGIPYIEAGNDADAWYGLGFCHGQDRGFQLEALARVARGTMAEFAGKEALPIDRVSRRIGFHDTATRQLATMTPDQHIIMDAYAKGVNDGRRHGGKKQAHEFALVRMWPSTYEPVDVLGAMLLMSFGLAANWDIELARLKILTEDGPDALRALDPTYPAWQPLITPPGQIVGEVVDRLAGDLRNFMEKANPGGGSNNWAVNGQRTATGRPMLANDPHLGSILPPYWYLARVTTPDWSVAGATFAGAPGMPIGHNGYASWGITAGLTDNTDLFIEEVGKDGASIRQGDEFVPCPVRIEEIKVKGGKTVTEKVLVTPRGPVVGPALDGGFGAISMCATWLQPKPISGLFDVHKVRSFDEFRAVFRNWPGLALNMVYADQTGDIGWQLVGGLPRRKSGFGTLPLPGWAPGVGWEADGVPFDDMPYVKNPDVNFVATANNQPAIDDANGDAPFLGVDWLDGYRIARIVEVLQDRSDMDVSDMMELQMDQTSVPWRELRAVVLGLVTSDAGAQTAMELLGGWDGKVAADSPEAALFEIFLAEMSDRVVGAKAPKAGKWALGHGYSMILPHNMLSVRRIGHLVNLMRRKPNGWFDGGWDAEMAAALTAAQGRLGKHKNRQWGRVRPLTLKHPFGEKKPMDKVFNLGPFPWGGDANTVAQAANPENDPTGNPMFIASLRMVVDVGDWSRCRYVLPGGQSGNPFSPHYGDQLPLWRAGKGVTIAWLEVDVAKASRHELRLEPGR